MILLFSHFIYYTIYHFHLKIFHSTHRAKIFYLNNLFPHIKKYLAPPLIVKSQGAFEKELAVRAAAASIYSTCNMIMTAENVPCF
ncbi:hypothetical protein IEQ34_001908 [Dendrobium chrysotoxum]|uniref:Uncharacterized protein n=1 Tax=Dendrobium chrysotoxum TaxID=161865 RepID=A0AAV7HI60_DENCH|nr:hypothetical protein IEQ34_001908 [Dendrobium chrysotoxum]